MCTSGPTAIPLCDGATNGTRFRTSVIDTLVPMLRPCNTVILDNLNVHEVVGVRRAIEAVGAQVRYLPANAGLTTIRSSRRIPSSTPYCVKQQPAPSQSCW